MAANERSRDQLRRSLERVLGPEETDTLMAALPSERPATKTDVEVIKTDVEVIKTDVEVIKTDVEVIKTDVGALRSDLSALEIKMDAGFEVLEYRFMGALHRELGLLRTDFSAQLIAQTRTFIFATISTLIALAALGVAALRFS